ncbi:MAG: CapA family protein [Myxococcota bacterium]
MSTLRIFCAGDVMTGRGVDQILPHPGDPRIQESFLKDARDYVQIAEQANGRIPRRAEFSYPWGEALKELERYAPHARVVNLETSVTRSNERAPKGINYRMAPGNVRCLQALGLHCATLANNHVLDWGVSGLLETLEVLHAAKIATAGAGATLSQARAPVIVECGGHRRLLVFALAFESSGVPEHWAAGVGPGVWWLGEPSDAHVGEIAKQVAAAKAASDVVMVSIHWGGNWGYEVTKAERRFAQALVERAQVDLIVGHSSHHPKGLEVHRGKLILYGCGDFVNDYEGISGHEQYRSELRLMYLASLRANGELSMLEIVPFVSRRFRLERVSRDDAVWLFETLARESARFDTNVSARSDGTLVVSADG